MSGAALERFLARLYTDRELRERFLADPLGTAAEAGIDAERQQALADIDRAGLELAAESFRRKRGHAEHGRRRPGWLARLRRRFSG